ncbi:MAG TPA: helix-turn-helix domain-containing protein [Polyangiaceae bacterium]|jgi:transcriptional regulator with XRE-family HTH domain
MAVFLNRPIGDLVVRARQTLGMTQRQFGEALGSSHRTAQRWDAGRASPSIMGVRRLARLVYGRDPSLAAELAAACSESLLSLGLVQPPPPAPPPPLPRALILDAVLCAAAEAAKVRPSAVRAGIVAAFARAKELGVGAEELAELVIGKGAGALTSKA